MTPPPDDSLRLYVLVVGRTIVRRGRVFVVARSEEEAVAAAGIDRLGEADLPEEHTTAVAVWEVICAGTTTEVTDLRHLVAQYRRIDARVRGQA